MRSLPTDTRRAIGVLYIAAVIILVVELAEVIVLTYPPHTDIPSWRFGVIGVLVSKTANFVLADVIVLATAFMLDHRRVLRVVGILHLLFGILLLPVMAMYLLDDLVMRPLVKPQFARGFDLNALRSLVTLLLSCFACLLVFWRSRVAPISREEPREPQRAVLITDLPPGER